MSEIKHRLKANLFENVLTEDPNDFIARVSAERTLSIPDICNSAAGRGGADVSATAMEHSVNLFLKEMGYQLSDGFSVNTGYFTATPLIKGVFNSPMETFNPSKHSVLFQFNQGGCATQNALRHRGGYPRCG
ncbi:DNA-binding domain-containing protein [Parabacteroides sp. FAFU027]|uniref:DNA-binding domain-containing protein n=1 Tax=Parabacteroides sp. FAFU027 TaxID=2922715 RepID=UPI001FAEB73E|nr:DNA-binding domain-containing protein [Parabacteroides sp. FAFU027]